MSSLRSRVAVVMALLSFVVTASFGAASYRSTRNQLLSEVDQSLSQFDLRSPGPLPENDAWSTFVFQLIGGDGALLRSTADSAIATPDVEQAINRPGVVVVATVSNDDHEYRSRLIGLRKGALQVLRPMDETNRILAGVRLWTAALVLTISALAALLGWWLAGRLTAPLRRLTALTEHVASTGDLDVSVEQATDDEVGRLSVGFNSMIAALRRSRTEQQRLVQDAGHELRTPLTSMRTNVSLLHRHPDLAVETRQEILDDLQTETEALTVLVNEIVAIASGDLDDEPVQPVDLRALADDVAERFARRAGRDVNVAGVGSASVTGRPRSIERAISCLVENACKFDDSDGPIEIEVHPDRVAVSDRGPGLADADQARLFDRFYRAESIRSLPGSGLGLSIVKQVCDRHGGTVAAAERDGGGAVFTISFPMTQPSDASDAADRPTGAVESPPTAS